MCINYVYLMNLGNGIVKSLVYFGDFSTQWTFRWPEMIIHDVNNLYESLKFNLEFLYACLIN